MFMFEKNLSQPNHNVTKWMSLGVMQRLEQVQCIAEMLNANMEDISAQIIDLQIALERLEDGTDTIEQEIEDLACMIEREFIVTAEDSSDTSVQKTGTDDDLPF